MILDLFLFQVLKLNVAQQIKMLLSFQIFEIQISNLLFLKLKDTFQQSNDYMQPRFISYIMQLSFVT